MSARKRYGFVIAGYAAELQQFALGDRPLSEVRAAMTILVNEVAHAIQAETGVWAEPAQRPAIAKPAKPKRKKRDKLALKPLTAKKANGRASHQSMQL